MHPKNLNRTDIQVDNFASTERHPAPLSLLQCHIFLTYQG